MLGNNDVRISYVVTGTDPSPLYRNAIGDECVYVQEGAGTVETVFGVLSYRTGDYVLIPRATDHRWVPAEPSRLYAIEANSHIAPPKRYLSRYGQLLEHAPYCERDLHGPTETHLVEGTDVEVLVKHRVSNVPGGVGGSRLTYATHPFDVVGWDGCLYPHTFNVEDYMPITGKVHQPPPVHQVFEGHNFVVCNFVPRKVDYHPLAIAVPYYHSNVDSDEVMFYVGGDYEARKGSGINIGSISLHPGGHAHGPQPSAIEASLGAEAFDELAVMIDTFLPLDFGEAGLAAEDPAYAWTWAGRGPDASDATTTGDGGPAVYSNSLGLGHQQPATALAAAADLGEHRRRLGRAGPCRPRGRRARRRPSGRAGRPAAAASRCTMDGGHGDAPLGAAPAGSAGRRRTCRRP